MADFALGLIEGFYGRQWNWAERGAMADFLGQCGYSHYIYAPKGDSNLRSRWREPFPDEWLAQLKLFGARCHGAGLKWGLGLSPMGVQASYNARDREVLLRIAGQIQALNIDVLWLLFDDMRGDHAQLAANQCAATADVRSVFSGDLAVCPSYYSSDPVLDEVFGQRPPDYLRSLSDGLAAEVDILWTGEKVISTALGKADCEVFNAVTGRKPLLWDNYPVNDGRKTSRHLHLNAFTGRSPVLRECARGHFVNPMNQPALSELALSSLPHLYTEQDYDPDDQRLQSFARLPAPLARLLERDWPLFQMQGLDAIDTQKNNELRADYARCQHPAAREIEGWLAGDYQFDPDSLTE